MKAAAPGPGAQCNSEAPRRRTQAKFTVILIWLLFQNVKLTVTRELNFIWAHRRKENLNFTRIKAASPSKHVWKVVIARNLHLHLIKSRIETMELLSPILSGYFLDKQTHTLGSELYEAI